jgi:hypothetical protein
MAERKKVFCGLCKEKVRHGLIVQGKVYCTSCVPLVVDSMERAKAYSMLVDLIGRSELWRVYLAQNLCVSCGERFGTDLKLKVGRHKLYGFRL